MGEVHRTPACILLSANIVCSTTFRWRKGVTPLAGTGIVITHSGHPDQPQRIKMTAGAAPQPENNPEIIPGDTIFVERTGIVYVVGDVARPGGFPMDHDEQLTILQAIALAQGTNPTAAKASARLIRSTPQGRQEIPVDLKKILSAKSTDLPCKTTTFCLCRAVSPRTRCGISNWLCRPPPPPVFITYRNLHGQRTLLALRRLTLLDLHLHPQQHLAVLTRTIISIFLFMEHSRNEQETLV